MKQFLRSLHLKHVAPLVVYSIAIFVISSMPQPPAPEFPFQWGDKINHAGAFFVMMLLAVRAASGVFPERSFRFRLLIAFSFCLVYGAFDEVHQAFVPGRFCDLYDWFADVAGALLGATVIRLIDHTSLGTHFFGARPS